MSEANNTNTNSIATDFEHWIMVGLIMAVIVATLGTVAKDFYATSGDVGNCASATLQITEGGPSEPAVACRKEPV